MRRTYAFYFVLLIALFASPQVAGACAALFSPEAQVRQSAQRIIFAVDRAAGTVEAYVSVNYVGAAENFAWIVPLPNNPQVDVIEPATFNALELATNPRFRFPARNCPELALGGAGAPAGAPRDGVQVLQQGQVGPFDFSVVGGANGGELTTWLRDNGYRVTAPMEPLIDSYTDMGMVFLAMKLQGGKESGDIKPVKMVFKADQAMIPLRLAAVGAEPGTELLVWVFADSQVAPQNLQRLTIPDAQVALTSYSGSNNYPDLVDAALQQAGGRGLITEAAQPSSVLTNERDPLIAELRNRFAYVTRFYGRFDPEQMTTDPIFKPQDGLADIPIERDFRDRVNPYSCLNRDVLPMSEQAVAARSLPGWWITWRWWVACLSVPLILTGTLIAVIARRRRQSRPAT